jgi:hypothetical protein
LSEFARGLAGGVVNQQNHPFPDPNMAVMLNGLRRQMELLDMRVNYLSSSVERLRMGTDATEEKCGERQGEGTADS